MKERNERERDGWREGAVVSEVGGRKKGGRNCVLAILEVALHDDRCQLRAAIYMYMGDESHDTHLNVGLGKCNHLCQ